MSYKLHIAILVCASALLGVVLLLLEREQSKAYRLSSIIREKTDSLRHYKTASGRQAVEKPAAIASVKDFKEYYPELAEELKKEYKVMAKDLRAVIRAEFEARGQGQGTVSNTYFVDSTGRRYKEFSMDDGYLRFKTTLFDSLTNAPYNYTYGDTLTYGFKTEKKWLLANEKLYGFGGLKNPNAKIVSATNVLIDDYRDKRFFIGPAVTYDIEGRVTIGISAGWALFKF